MTVPAELINTAGLEPYLIEATTLNCPVATREKPRLEVERFFYIGKSAEIMFHNQRQIRQFVPPEPVKVLIQFSHLGIQGPGNGIFPQGP